jgi:hypothetical protein
LYIAKHDSGGNDEEGAIYHALTSLGHKVTRVPERLGGRATVSAGGHEMVLFHKWYDPDALLAMKGIIRVFWHWDLVDHPDPSLARRCALRRDRMKMILPHVELGFCSDGDWVAQDTTGKLIKLTQGADARNYGLTSIQSRPELLPILFTGLSKNCGDGRLNFVAEIQARYGNMFRQVAQGVHGHELMELIQSAMIVVAPDAPVTDDYWSNRVYLTLGFGGFLLHPYCEQLTHQYRPNTELVYYRDRQELHEKIDKYLKDTDLRREIAARGSLRTYNEHTYTHRCEYLINTVKERSCLGKFMAARSV